VRDLAAGTTELVSAGFGGQPSDGRWPAISGDGRFVAFSSWASDLVPGDTNGFADVFVRDRATGVTTRVSVDSTGVEGNGPSQFPDITADGRLVAFFSDADNLVAQDTNGVPDVFVHDRVSGLTERASVDSGGNQIPFPFAAGAASLSPDGRFVGFSSSADNLVLRDQNGVGDVFVRDLQLSCPPMALYCSSKKNSAGCKPKISAAGSPSVSGRTAFFVISTQQVNQQQGLFFWGTSSKGTPFQGGTLCVRAPLQRTPVQASGGKATGSDCSGTFSFTFDAAYMASRGLSAGTTVYGQYWSTDSAPSGVGLTDGLQFTICP